MVRTTRATQVLEDFRRRPLGGLDRAVFHFALGADELALTRCLSLRRRACKGSQEDDTCQFADRSVFLSRQPRAEGSCASGRFQAGI